MTSSILSFRSLALASATLAVAASAQALTLPVNGLVADSVQQFSDEAQQAFELYATTVTPRGTAFAVPNATSAFDLPITSITIGPKLNIASGTAQGSALEITRMYRKTLKDTPVKVGFTIANFTIDYNKKQVLADTTILGGTTVRQATVYDYSVSTPLAFKYKFPLSITLHEVLDNLMLTESAKDTFMAGLVLPPFARDVISSFGFGTLTQDIIVKFRPKAINPTPYKPAP